ncbi:MAG: ABC transporter permease subunit, partial [Acidimicrobiia bacterium]
MGNMTDRPSPSFVRSSARIFDLSLTQMLLSKRSIFLALLALAAVALALIFRVVAWVHCGPSGGPLRIEGRQVAGAAIFGLMIWLFHLRFIVPALGVFYGTALIADEVDDKTITYLFTRPIPRGAVLLGKYLAYAVCTTLMILPSVMLVYFLLVPIGGGSLAAHVPALFTDLGLLALGLVAYGAVFAFVGAQFGRPLLFGLIFAFGWEQAVLLFPGYLKRLTVAYYLQSLTPHAMPADSATSLLQAIMQESVSAPVALGTLALISGGFLLLAIQAVERREYVLEQ